MNDYQIPADDAARKLTSRGRKAYAKGRKVYLPRKYDPDGKSLTVRRFSGRKHLWDFTPKEADLLAEWRAAGWDFDKAIRATGYDPEWSERFLKKAAAQAFKSEADRDKLLSDIPTIDWLKARLMEASQNLSELTDTQKWAYEKLKDIIAPKAGINLTTNILNVPQFTPEEMAKIKELGDKLADLQLPEVPRI